jgi:ABC-type multidrug transport system fused ATPase/permease subunit
MPTVFFEIIDTQDQIQDTGKIEAPLFDGNISFEDVRFRYIAEEEVIKGINLEFLQDKLCYSRIYRCRKINDYQFIKSFYEINS